VALSRLNSRSIIPRATDTADRSAWKESDGDSPDTRAVKYLLKQGVSRIAALEAYSKASQTAYWTKVTLADNVFSVIEYLDSVGVGSSLPELLVAHPNVLAYNVEDRLKPAIDYLVEIGVEDVAQVIAKRPSLLGLDPENQLRRMVGYFQANDFSQEEIIDMICNNV